MSFLQHHGAHWSTGVLQAWCDDKSHPNYTSAAIEYFMPLMHQEDWDAFDMWLQDLHTPFPWPLEQLLMSFEVNHGPLRIEYRSEK